MTVAELKDKVCEDLVIGVYERHDRTFIATRFTYPVGDSVNLYLIGDPPEQRLSDLGTTHYFLRVADVDWDTDARVEFVKSVCAGFDVELGDDFSLSKNITPETAASDVLDFCQAITRISALHYDHQAKQYQTFAKEVDAFVSRTVPKDRLAKQWSDPHLDPNRDYPIDYHLSGSESRNLFVVRSRLSAEAAAATMNFYWAHKRLDQSMSIIAPELELPTKAERRLGHSSRVIFGLKEEDIKRFVGGRT